MILLEDSNVIIHTLLTERLREQNPKGLDQLFVDFDSVSYHLSAPDKSNRNMLVLSMAMRRVCWDELVSHGALDTLRREYGEWLQEQVEGNTMRSDGSTYSWDVTLMFDMGPNGIGGLPEEEAVETIRKLSLIKRCVGTSIPMGLEHHIGEWYKLTHSDLI
jgi:hypothetical protein